MNFPEISDDDRREWRDDPVTHAFIAWMKAQADAMNAAAIAAVRDASTGSIGVAGQYVGKLEAYIHAVDTATRETFE